jgi:hypothetical protein
MGAAFNRAGLVISPAVFPPVAMVKRDEILALIVESQLPDTAPSIGDHGNPGSDSHGEGVSSVGFLNREPFDSL